MIDLGAFFGYYAIGLALLLPEAHGIVYEADPARREILNANILANGVGARVTVRGEASLHTLSADARRDAADPVVCDIDGPEIDVINPAESPGLDGCALLIETHGDDITAALKARLSPTHTVQHIRPRIPNMDDVPARPWYLHFSDPIQFLAERPHNNDWLWARPDR